MLKDKNVLIIGGGGLLGRSLCVAALQSGAKVIAAGRTVSDGDFTEMDDVDRENLRLIQADITEAETVETLLSDAAGEGALDAVVNCSFPRSKNYGARFEDVAHADFCENVNMHLGSAFLVCQKAAAYFQTVGGGNIINISSIYGLMAPRFEIYEGTEMTKEVEYIVSKSAIIHLTKYLAKYLKGQNIRVNCVSPGGIANQEPEPFRSNYDAQCMNKGMLDGGDVAGAVVFLLSDLSTYVNGQNIVVDDGFSL